MKYSTKEFAVASGVPWGTLRRWAMEGRLIPVERRGKKGNFYDESQIAEAQSLYLEKRPNAKLHIADVAQKENVDDTATSAQEAAQATEMPADEQTPAADEIANVVPVIADTPAQVADFVSDNQSADVPVDGEKKSPVMETAEKILDNKENNSEADNSTSAAENQPVATPVDIEKFALINKISAGTLAAYGFLTVTKYSNKNRGNPSRFKCPFCGSHELTPYEGGSFVQWRCDCFGDDFKRNEDLLAKTFGLDVDADKAEIYRRVKEKMPDFDKPTESMITPNVNVGLFADGTPAENNPKTDGDISIEQQIIDDIEISNGGFEDLPVEEKRCIRDEIARRLKIGATKSWYHPKMPNTPSTTRFICRLGDETDPPSYNAILTPAERRRVEPLRERYKKQGKKPPKWTDKSLTANSKLVFNPTAIDDNDGLLCVTEGEFDCASIVQATNFQVAACALGGAGQFKDFEARLRKLNNPPKVIVLFDRDAKSQTGQLEAPKLVAELAEMRIAAVAKFFEDVMSDDELKIFGGKVDANEILQKRGDEFLADVIGRIIGGSKAELDALKEKFAAEKSSPEFKDVSPEIFHDEKSRPKKNVTAADKKTVTDILGIVHARQLSRSDWVSVGMVMKNYGFTLEDFKTWSNDGDSRYNAAECASQWRTFKTTDQLDGKGFTIGTLINIAKKYGYEPLKKKFVTVEDHMTGDEEIDVWQKVNGVIDPSILNGVRDAQKMLLELSPEKITAQFLLSMTTMRQVALCKHYSFAADAVVKFFDVVSTAKSDADAQIKAAKKNDGLTCEPSDEVKAIARITLSELKADIDKQVTKIRRQHKDYVKDVKRKQNKAQYKAAVEKYLAGNPTTKKFIPDCPVDILVPANIFFDAKIGVGLDDATDSGNIKRRVAALKPVTLTRKLCESNTGVVEYEIAIKTGGKWHTHTVDGRALQSARGIDVLGGYGLPIEDPTALQKFFARLIAANDETLPTTKVYTQTGWLDDNFTTFIYPSRDADYRVRRNGFDFEKEFACRGDAAIWKEKFLNAMTDGGSKARVYVGTALAAPLIRPFNISNLQTHFLGDSGSGKTGLEKFTASIFGNPLLLIRTFEATAKNKQAVSAAYNDLPTFLDELGTVNGKKAEDALSQSVYAFSLGNQNQAQNRNGDTRPLVKFFGARLSTGERAILKNHDARGTFKRLLQIQCDKIFDDEVATDLHVVAEKNFGHFGRMWIEYVTAHVNAICARFETYAKIFVANQKQYEPTLIKAIVAAAVAYQYFKICIGAQIEFDEETCEDDTQAIIDELPTITEMSDDVRALARLRSFVASHPKHFAKESEANGTIQEVAAWNSPTYGKHFHDGAVAFLPTELEKILTVELGFASYDALVDAWRRKDLLITNAGRRDRRIHLGKSRPRTIYFKPNVVGDEYEAKDIYVPPFPPTKQQS